MAVWWQVPASPTPLHLCCSLVPCSWARRRPPSRLSAPPRPNAHRHRRRLPPPLRPSRHASPPCPMQPPSQAPRKQRRQLRVPRTPPLAVRLRPGRQLAAQRTPAQRMCGRSMWASKFAYPKLASHASASGLCVLAQHIAFNRLLIPTFLHTTLTASCRMTIRQRPLPLPRAPTPLPSRHPRAAACARRCPQSCRQPSRTWRRPSQWTPSPA